jgi:predicted dehydrogenase
MAGKGFGIGFLGTGDIAVMHARALKELVDVRLVGVWNRTESRGRQRAQEFGCRWFNSAEELVRDPEVDAVFVLTNLETHLQYARLAVMAGKHLLVEKPVGATVEEVQEIARIARQAGVICMPGHNMIYEQGIVRGRQMIDRGELGRILSCYVLYNIYHDEQRASTYPGVIRQILTHNLYTMMYLAGRPKRVVGLKAALNHEDPLKEDLALVLLELENGALAHICVSFAADDQSPDPWPYLVKVIGTQGSARYTYADWVSTRKGLAHSRTYTGYQGSLTNEDSHFVHICRHGGEPLSGMEEAVIAQRTLEAVERSIAEERVMPV